jgi:hypothetical protein
MIDKCPVCAEQLTFSPIKLGFRDVIMCSAKKPECNGSRGWADSHFVWFFEDNSREIGYYPTYGCSGLFSISDNRLEIFYDCQSLQFDLNESDRSLERIIEITNSYIQSTMFI